LIPTTQLTHVNALTSYLHTQAHTHKHKYDDNVCVYRICAPSPQTGQGYKRTSFDPRHCSF
jgi:hypothetical protein